MAFNPMQQQQSPDMLMAMMTDPRATPQQRMAAMSALNTMRGGAIAPQQPPQMTGDSTGVSQIDPAFMAAVRQEVMGQGPEEQPEIPQRQAAPEAPQDPSTEALMSGAADASRVASMAHGGAVRGYAEGGKPQSLSDLLEIINDPTADPADRARAEALRKKDQINNFYTTGAGKDSPQFVKDIDKLDKYIPEPSFLPSLIYKGAKAVTDFAVPKVTKYFTGYDTAPADEAAPTAETASVDTAAPVVATAPVVKPRVAPVVNAGDGVLKVGPEIANKLINAPPNIAQDVPKKKDYFKLLEEKLTENKSGISSQDKYMALLQASLGTMAAASQPGAKLLGSIGQGGMAGIKQIEDARVLRAKERAGDLDTYAKLAEIQQKSKEKVLSKGQEAIDTNYGKEYADFLSRGGASVSAGQLKNLSDARNIITDAITNKKDITGPVASFVTSENMPKWVGGFAAPETVTVQDMVNSVAQSNLRVTLGSQFAQKEGEGVLQRVFNPALSPQENLRRLDMMMSSIDSASKAKQAQAKFFKENDTLAGYEGPSVDDYLYELRDNLDKSDKNNLRKGKKTNSAPIEPGNYTFDPDTGGFTPQ